MGVDVGLYAWVEEALAPIGTVSLRKMMGAATLYLDGTIFAVLDDSELWLKSDDESNAAWDAAGCERFAFTTKDGRTETMNYRRAPADVHDDADAMREWATLALGAGLRSASRKRRKR